MARRGYGESMEDYWERVDNEAEAGTYGLPGSPYGLPGSPYLNGNIVPPNAVPLPSSQIRAHTNLAAVMPQTNTPQNSPPLPGPGSALQVMPQTNTNLAAVMPQTNTPQNSPPLPVPGGGISSLPPLQPDPRGYGESMEDYWERVDNFNEMDTPAQTYGQAQQQGVGQSFTAQQQAAQPQASGGFTGGTGSMAQNQSFVYQSESPEIAARKLAMIDFAKNELYQTPPRLTVGSFGEEGRGQPTSLDYNVAPQNQLQEAVYSGAAGLGGFSPYLQSGQDRISQGIGQLNAAGQQYGASADLANLALRGYAPTQEGAISGIGQAVNMGQGASAGGALGIGQQLSQAQQYQQAAARGLGMGATQGQRAYADAQAAANQATQGARRVAGGAQQGFANVAGQARAGAGSAQSAVDRAAQNARQSTAAAQGALRQAGQFGIQSARQGIAGLAGTTGQYDPTSAAAYMNPYEDAVVQRSLQDVQRASDIAGQRERAAAVQAGAFGGARSGIVASERGRNALEQQARIAAQLRQQGFQSAQQQAQQAFEASQGRGQQAAQLTGQLGQAGASSGMQSAQSAGQLGLGAEQLAQSGALQGGQLGLSAQQLAQAGISQGGQMGMSAEQLAAQMASNMGQQGLSAAQLRADTASKLGSMGAQYGQLGVGGEEAASRLGLMGADMTGQMAQALNQVGLSGGQLGMQGADALARAGSGYGATGQSYGQMGELTGAMGELGQTMQLRDIDAMSKLGAQQQQYEQARLDAARQTELMKVYEPYQRAGFYSDLLQGAPSTSMTISRATSPQPSLLNQLTGAAATGIGLAGAATTAGII